MPYQTLVTRICAILLLSAALCCLSAQTPAPNAAAPTYRLGPEDELTIRVLDLADEIGDQTFRLDQEGAISLPMVGRVQAGGLTLAQLEAELAKRYKRFLRDPQVNVSVAKFRSQPVSVLGYVNTPGMHQIEGGKTLFEVISLAGGLSDGAGSIIKITRQREYGPIPLPGAELDSTGSFTVAQVSVKAVIGGQDPAENIAIRPHDVITVPKGDIVYVVGSVKKPGGYLLGDRDVVSVLQSIAVAEGLDRNAAPSKAKILRTVPGSTGTTEIPVNLKAILAGKAPDVPIGANDVLFIPSSTGLKSGSLKAAEIAASLAGYAVIYHY